MITWSDVKKVKEDNKRNRRVKRLRLAFTIFAALFICLVINYQRINLKKKQVEYADRIEKLDKKYKEEEARTEEIEQYKAYVQTKQFAEDIAREKLGLVYPNEIIFKAEEE